MKGFLNSSVRVCVYWCYYEGGGPGAKPADDAFLFFFILLIFGYNDVATLLFTSSNMNRANRFRTNSRAHDMKSNDEIPFVNRFLAVIECTHWIITVPV